MISLTVEDEVAGRRTANAASSSCKQARLRSRYWVDEERIEGAIAPDGVEGASRVVDELAAEPFRPYLLIRSNIVCEREPRTEFDPVPVLRIVSLPPLRPDHYFHIRSKRARDRVMGARSA